MLALKFNNNGALIYDNVPPITFPATLGCFFALGSPYTTNDQTYVGLTIPTGNGSNNFISMGTLAGNAAVSPGYYAFKLSGPRTAIEKELVTLDSGPVVNAWVFCMLVWTNATDVYYHTPVHNPTSPHTAGISDMANTAFTRVTIGGCPKVGTTTWLARGHITNPFVYRRALTREDYNQLAAGVSPEDLYPKDIAFYVPNLVNYLDVGPGNWYGDQPATLFGTSPTMGTIEQPPTQFPMTW